MSIGEDYVRFAWQLFEVFTEPQAPLVQFRPHTGFQSRILPLYPESTEKLSVAAG